MKSEIRFEIKELIEEYEWLVSYREDNDEMIYVVSISYDDIDWVNKTVSYIHIENIDWIYHVSGGDYAGVERAYELFKVIQREVIEEII